MKCQNNSIMLYRTAIIGSCGSIHRPIAMLLLQSTIATAINNKTQQSNDFKKIQPYMEQLTVSFSLPPASEAPLVFSNPPENLSAAAASNARRKPQPTPGVCYCT